MASNGFLSTYGSGALRLTSLSMSVSEDAPDGPISVSVSISPGDMSHNFEADDGALAVECKPRLLVTVSDASGNVDLASFELGMVASCRCAPVSDGSLDVDAIGEAYLECLLSAYSFARGKIYELASVSPMDGLLLPNAHVEGMRKMVMGNLVD